MIRNLQFTLVLVAVFSTSILSQSENSNSSLIGKTIEVDLVPEKGLIYTHTIKAGHTLYSLSRLFQTDVSDLKRLNSIQEEIPISLEQKIAIPFDARLMLRKERVDLASCNCVPVYYTIKPKDNLFRLSRLTFDQAIPDMMERNQLQDYNLSLDQKLLVGWMPLYTQTIGPKVVKVNEISSVDGNPVENAVVGIEKDDNIVIKDTIGIYIKNELTNYPTPVETVKKLILKKNKSLAIWDKAEDPNQGSMYVLHRNAKVDSIIELYNPLLNRRAYATVVGHIPEESYTPDVGVILSAKVASALGAIDSRFIVEVKYYE